MQIPKFIRRLGKRDAVILIIGIALLVAGQIRNWTHCGGPWCR